ncbi:uncharacterized protein LOC127751203 [Frankliniella occidentalis]|uniref:Uncharacterized protein LOC127751203 n=1 Tax=Frankliniella occidentalis TaxID=133901 RepID=A0A9C6X700_FRAOC|nr:uncharacterized protein LOC127751203 [Frankliniella occidentalis]
MSDSLNSEYVHNITSNYATKLKIAHLNAQSLCDVAHQTEFLEIFSNSGLDIITVSETWFKNKSHFILPGYNMYNVSSKDRNGGGVAVFIKSEYKAKILEVSNGEFDKPEFIFLDILIGSVKVLFAGIYRRPKAGHMDLFMDVFYKYVTDYKYTFVCGDINAGFGRGGDDTKMITEVIRLCDLDCVPFQSTFHTAYCDSNLDIIASNCPDHLLSYGQTPAPGFSCHDLIYAIYDLTIPRSKKQAISYINFSNIVVCDLLQDMCSAPWHEMYNQNNMDCKLDCFNNIITDLMDKHAPYITKSYNQQSAPWMTQAIKALIKKRDKLRKKWHRAKNQTDFENFKNIRNNVKQSIRSAKVRTLQLGKGKSMRTEPVIPVNDSNSHYSSVASVNDAVVVSGCTEDYTNRDRLTSDSAEKFHFKYVLPEDIVSAINSIKSKAMGIDLIPVNFIKMCLPALLPVLDHLFNYSLQNGIFPNMWKLANIIPVPKCLAWILDFRFPVAEEMMYRLSVDKTRNYHGLKGSIEEIWNVQCTANHVILVWKQEEKKCLAWTLDIRFPVAEGNMY